MSLTPTHTCYATLVDVDDKLAEVAKLFSDEPLPRLAHVPVEGTLVHANPLADFSVLSSNDVSHFHLVNIFVSFNLPPVVQPSSILHYVIII